ncbi:GNAT family N-acetyltransferase [Croceicoccus sp. YJ47]|uniref:GNAT family N-acetyltransferase n=1 Tax=Croceicoccus sp. YJ47 TaxID=2798724 RepID=UPI001923A3A9|nr:N-acetyltransferase [Croceicoccus sp. YJ47]QQN75057.1 GNAT family N-acetyltransferase [Croceicoccus sp. YJ47]
MTIHYRAARMDDTDALAALGRDSFVAAFGHVYDPADLAAFLQQVYARDAVAEEIADPAMIHRLAFAGDEMVGYCKLIEGECYPGQSDAQRPITLGQIYTAPDRTGQGIGRVLAEWAIAEARSRGCDAIQLSVWSENEAAQRFYARHGFQKIADIDFWVGDHRDDEYLYERRL